MRLGRNLAKNNECWLDPASSMAISILPVPYEVLGPVVEWGWMQFARTQPATTFHNAPNWFLQGPYSPSATAWCDSRAEEQMLLKEAVRLAGPSVLKSSESRR